MKITESFNVTVRGETHFFIGLERAATFAAARRLDGETDIAYGAPGISEALRTHYDTALIERVEELLAPHGKTL